MNINNYSMDCLCCTTYYHDEKEDIVTCNQCSFSICVECLKYGILQQTTDPYCLHCKTLFPIETILETCETTWLKDKFLPHLASILLEKEKEFLPYAQEEATIVRKYREYQECIRLLPTDKQLQRKYKKDPEEYERQKQQKDMSKKQLQDKKKQLRQESTILLVRDLTQPSTGNKMKKMYVAKCMKDGCKGYVNTQYVCETCESTICNDCFRIMEEEEDVARRHVCRKEDKDLAHILRSNCKQCPKCYLPIMKAGGCDQMFCVNCKTGFSWETGEIVVGQLHNPHYFEWLSSQNSNHRTIDIETIACGDLPDYLVVFHASTASRHRSATLRTYREILHAREVVLPPLVEDRVKNNMDLRVQFLLDEITYDQWKRKLLFRERKRWKNAALRQVIDMFILVATDLMRRLVSRTTTSADIEQECRALTSYRDECLERVCRIYGGSFVF